MSRIFAMFVVVAAGCGGAAIGPEGSLPGNRESPEARSRPADPERVPELMELVEEMISDHEGWTQVTVDPRDKIVACPCGADPCGLFDEDGQSVHRPGEMFHTFVRGGVAQYRQGVLMPDQSAVLKRTFRPSTGEITAYYVMYKQPGYNPEGGDWIYGTAGPDRQAIVAGTVDKCAGCHLQRKDADYLFRKL